MNRLLNRLARRAGLSFLILSLVLASCAGGMEETAVEPAGEPADEAPAEVQSTAVPPTVEPTPDFGTVAYDVPRNMVREEAYGSGDKGDSTFQPPAYPDVGRYL